MLTPFEFLGYIVIIMFNSIIFHEFGHFVYLKYLGFKPKIVFEWSTDEKGLYTAWKTEENKLNRYQTFLMYFYGIMVGIVPIMIGAIYYPFLAVLFVLYIIGIRRDLKGIFYTLRG